MLYQAMVELPGRSRSAEDHLLRVLGSILISGYELQTEQVHKCHFGFC